MPFLSWLTFVPSCASKRSASINPSHEVAFIRNGGHGTLTKYIRGVKEGRRGVPLLQVILALVNYCCLLICRVLSFQSKNGFHKVSFDLREADQVVYCH